MPSEPVKIYWDSCAWLGYINDDEPARKGPLALIWEAATRGKYKIYTSTLSYIEVAYGRNEHGQAYPPQEFDMMVINKIDQPHVERIQLDSEVAKLARDLKRQYHPLGLKKRPDVIHLATAVYWNCEEFHTYDGSDLLHLNGKVNTRDGKSLLIRAPKPEPPGPLFADRPGEGADPINGISVEAGDRQNESRPEDESAAPPRALEVSSGPPATPPGIVSGNQPDPLSPAGDVESLASPANAAAADKSSEVTAPQRPADSE